MLIADEASDAANLRYGVLKRMKAIDNPMITALDSDKYASNYISHLKQFDASTFDSTTPPTDFDYVRHIKESKQYFIDANYGNNRENHGEPGCESYHCDKGNAERNNGQRQQQQQMHDGYANDYDDSLSMSGENSKDLLVVTTSNSGSSNDGARNQRSHADSAIGVKRKHFDEIIVDGDNNDIHKMYKADAAAAAGLGPNKFDYMKNFDGIRPRNIEEIQNDDHHRMMSVATAIGGGPVAGSDYRINSPSDENGSRCGEDGNTNVNVSYASSDDLNQTNASEHDDKMMSGSDDEGGGEWIMNIGKLAHL